MVMVAGELQAHRRPGPGGQDACRNGRPSGDDTAPAGGDSPRGHDP
jgi:hypothetical protein